MTAKALLDRNPNPSRDRSRRRSSGNLCRCTGYQQIVDSVEEARARGCACNERSAKMSDEAGKRFDVIGKPRRRVDGRAKVTGQLRYADDLTLPRMLHCKLLRSPHPHALIESIDAARAQGIRACTWCSPATIFRFPSASCRCRRTSIRSRRERVRYVGDPVAAVVAKDEQTASEALALIEVKYKPLPTIATPEEALAHPEPRIHDYGEPGNIHRNQSFEFGDVEEALAESDHVFEDLFFYEGNTHLAMEQHASLATVEGDGKLTLWTSTQNPHYLHRQLARVLQMPAAHIRVIACPTAAASAASAIRRTTNSWSPRRR